MSDGIPDGMTLFEWTQWVERNHQERREGSKKNPETLPPEWVASEADTQPIKTVDDSGEVSRELPATPPGKIDIRFTVSVPPPRSPPAKSK